MDEVQKLLHPRRKIFPSSQIYLRSCLAAPCPWIQARAAPQSPSLGPGVGALILPLVWRMESLKPFPVLHNPSAAALGHAWNFLSKPGLQSWQLKAPFLTPEL